MRFSIIIFCICFFYSCNQKVEYQKVDPFFISKRELVSVKYFSDEILHPDFMTRIGNILVISSTKSDSMLFYYHLPDMKLIEKTGRKGNAADEFHAFPMFCHTQTNNTLYIWGYTPISIKKITLNNEKDLEQTKTYNVSYESFNYMHVIKDSLLVYYLPDNLEIKKINLENNVSLGQVNLKKDSHNESFFYSNRGMIIANDSSVVHSYLFKRRIDIYDIETLKLKTVIGDTNNKVNIVEGDFNNVRYHYVNLVAGEKYFYALYSGHNNQEDPTGRKNKIEVYDYDGNPIIEYTFDIPPLLYTIDEKNQMIYGFNNFYEDYLLSYKM